MPDFFGTFTSLSSFGLLRKFCSCSNQCVTQIDRDPIAWLLRAINPFSPPPSPSPHKRDSPNSTGPFQSPPRHETNQTYETYSFLSRAAFCRPTITGIIPSSRPLSSVTIPLRTLASPSLPRTRDEHSTALLDSNNEKQGRRRSSDSVGSDFSLWSDTGDLAEQLADEEDPLQINLRGSFENQPARRGPRPQGRQSNHVHYEQQDHSTHKHTIRGIDKEAIQIPNPPPRKISRTEEFLARIMTGDRQSSHSHGLTGKPLLYAIDTMTSDRWNSDLFQVFHKCVCIVGGFFIWVRSRSDVGYHNVGRSQC